MSQSPKAASTAPLDLASGYLQTKTRRGLSELRRWRGEWWLWRGSAFSPLSDEELRAEIYSFLQAVKVGDAEESVKPRQRVVTEAIDALSAIAQLDSQIEPPCWLNGAHDDARPEDLVPVANGLIHLPTGAILSPTPAYWCHAASDIRYDRAAPEPQRWLRFIHEDTWPDDRESADTFQEILGYLVSGDTRLQKIPLLVGPRRAGKGTMLHIVRKLVGNANVSAPALSSLGLPFGLAPLIGRSVALISDARISGRADLAAVVETLLRISGGDVVTIPRKFKADWTGLMRLNFVIATNELPRLDDASGALASRLVILLLTRSHYGREDHHLLPTLEAELPGIMNWALEGLRRLRQHGRFVMPTSAQEVVRDMRALASPVSVFVDEVCRIDAAATVPMAGVYEAYRTWCEGQGIRPSSAQMFGRDLRAAVPSVRVSQPREDEKRTRIYNGLALLTSSLPRPPTTEGPAKVCGRCGGDGCEWCE